MRVLPTTVTASGPRSQEDLSTQAPGSICLDPRTGLLKRAYMQKVDPKPVQLFGRCKPGPRGRRPRNLPEGVKGAPLHPRISPTPSYGIFQTHCPLSHTTRRGAAILFMRASHARKFSLSAPYRPSTCSGLCAINTTA